MMSMIDLIEEDKQNLNVFNQRYYLLLLEPLTIQAID